jgi:hypothetical protein
MLCCVFSELLAMLADFIAAPIDPVAVHTLTLIDSTLSNLLGRNLTFL